MLHSMELLLLLLAHMVAIFNPCTAVFGGLKDICNHLTTAARGRTHPAEPIEKSTYFINTNMTRYLPGQALAGELTLFN